MPYVHLASPADQHDSAKSAACWSTHAPATGTEPPNRSVWPRIDALSTIVGSSLTASPKSSAASVLHSTRSRSSSSDREAVAASVTKPSPHNRWSSQVSVVVTARSP